MSKSAPELFVTEYENRIRQTFQRKGAKLLRTIRNKDPKGKEKVVMFVAGQGEAVERPARHQDIPFMNASRTKVELMLKAYFAGDPVDWEDLESMELDDVQTIADSAAYALGRKVDDVCITEMNGTALKVGDATKPMSLAFALEAIELAREQHWDEEEGSWFCAIPPNFWSHLMTYEQFAKAEFVGNENLPFLNKGNSRRWMGVDWMIHTGLKDVTGDATAKRGLLYFGPAIAGAGEPAGSDITWHGGQKQRWEIMDKVRAGCKRHEAEAVIAIEAAIDVDLRNAEHPAP